MENKLAAKKKKKSKKDIICTSFQVLERKKSSNDS